MRSMTRAWTELRGRIAIDEVSKNVDPYMHMGLASYDAVHAATANVAGVAAIVTTDTGFACLPTSTHLYVDSSRVSWCRRTRGGAGS